MSLKIALSTGSYFKTFLSHLTIIFFIKFSNYLISIKINHGSINWIVFECIFYIHKDFKCVCIIYSEFGNKIYSLKTLLWMFLILYWFGIGKCYIYKYASHYYCTYTSNNSFMSGMGVTFQVCEWIYTELISLC